MTEQQRDETFDQQLHDFLVWQASEIAGAPTATDVVARISTRIGPASTPLRLAPRLVWVVLAGLLVATLVGLGLAGASLLLPRPLSGASNGWIAFSTQPGWPEAHHECCGSGGDIYLVRDGVEAKMIVSRGSGNTSNVCPAFSPDGRTLAYGHRDGSSRALILLAVSPDGSVSETRRLDVPGDGNVPCPSWSTDGTRLAYLDGGSHAPDPGPQPATMVVRGLDGSTLSPGPSDPTLEELQLRRSGPVEEAPALASPSGELVVLTDNRGVVVQGPDGTDPRILAGPEGTPRYPYPDYSIYAVGAWSPDGKYVLAMVDVGSSNLALLEISVESPFEHRLLVPRVDLNSASNWPGRYDVSWQSVLP